MFKTGTGALTLSGTNNAWTGTTTVSGGMLNLAGGTIGTAGTSGFYVGYANGSGTVAGTVANGAVANIGGGTFNGGSVMVGYTGGQQHHDGQRLDDHDRRDRQRDRCKGISSSAAKTPRDNGTLGVGQVDLSGGVSTTRPGDTELGTRSAYGVLNISGSAAFNST